MVGSGGWFMHGPHGTELYRSSWSGSALAVARTGGFRQVELNAAGWAVVLAPGAFLGAVGGVVLHRSLWLTAPAGAMCSWMIAVLVDGRRWRRSECGYPLDDLDPVAASGLLVELERAGVPFRVEQDVHEPENARRILYVQMRHRSLVEAAFLSNSDPVPVDVATRRFPEEDLVPSPAGWQPPAGSRPGWDWVPPVGARPSPDVMPWWIRVLYRTPLLDRRARELMWQRGGFLVLPPDHDVNTNNT